MNKPDEQETALTLVEPNQISPLPVFSGMQMSEAFDAYRKLQTTLDTSMPDQLMTIQGRTFRKKGYWRAIRTSFNLVVECIKEEQIEHAGDWGYIATYKATASNGSSADGDGSCMAAEKIVYLKDWDAWKRNGKRGSPSLVKDSDGRPAIDEIGTSKNATLHNVRSHAHTRAFNRAVSNLVGFGEVSAEEINYQGDENKQPTRQAKQDTAKKKADKQKWYTPLWNDLKDSGIPDPADLWRLLVKQTGDITDLDQASTPQCEKFRLLVEEEIQAHKEASAQKGDLHD